MDYYTSQFNMKVLFIFAHPDDESLACGGTIAKMTKQDIQVELISATRGESGRYKGQLARSKNDMAKIRTKELQKAAKILGISQIHFLNFIDGALAQLPINRIINKIKEVVFLIKPDVVVTFDKTGGSNHPDHKTISKAATLVFDQYKKLTNKHVRLYHIVTPRSYIKLFNKYGLGYAAFGELIGVPDQEISTIVDIQDTFEIKIKALMCHKSQQPDRERFLKRVKLINLKREFFKLISENGII
jgi:LmbE family N-acetylglucosaminyl deacetylase